MINKNIKKLTALMLLMFGAASAAYAVNAGFYLGGQLGQSRLSNGTQTLQSNSSTPPEVVSPSNTGIAARLLMGYGFNKYAAWESGYTYYTPSTYNGDNVSGKIHEGSFDILAKGMIPISTSGFGVFAKAGVAFVGTTTSNAIVSSNLKGAYALITYGAGVSYDMTQQWVADLSYMTIPKRSSYTGASVTMLGISYHFVDVYCGQFLC